MIKYLELTAPESLKLKGAKIISTDVSEGDTVEAGDTLFTIMNDGKEVPLPSSMAGKIIELIAREGDGVSMLTPLLLLETEVKSSEATKPKNETPTPPAKDKNIVSVKVPDIGADDAKLVEVLVKEGDQIGIDDPIASLESDKASMEVPSTVIGVVHSIVAKLDSSVSQGDVLIEVMRNNATAEQSNQSKATETKQEQTNDSKAGVSDKTEPSDNTESDTAESTQQETVVIPDIGDGSAKVVEILVEVGDTVDIDDALITLESDKASMEVPSSMSGEVVEIKVSMDQDVSEGDAVVVLKTTSKSSSKSSSANKEPSADQEPSAGKEPSAKQEPSANKEPSANRSESSTPAASPPPDSKAHASPSVRRFARELGASLGSISGTGRKGRITHDDVKSFVKAQLQNKQGSSQASSGSGIPPVTNPDFSKFGDIEYQDLNRIKQLTAVNLHRSWLNVPHVTQNDEANIADLESFRKQTNDEYKRRNKNVKLSPLAFIVKAVVNGLQNYPQFNSSLSEDGKQLILKKYYNIGIAVDTPDGLVVPVVRNADSKSVAEIAVEMGDLAAKARDKKLTMADMSGACFTISSLGGIGGTGFTPIVNAPEVAILGVSRTKIQPHWNGENFEPVPVLPLSLSYDHRVIDGAEAARFTRHIADVLEDVRRLTI